MTAAAIVKKSGEEEEEDEKAKIASFVDCQNLDAILSLIGGFLIQLTFGSFYRWIFSAQ